jgi:hypothetical protein
MRKLIMNFLSNPSLATYEALRDRVIDLPSFRPEQSGDSRIWDLLEEGRIEEAEPIAEAARTEFLLSPATHVALGAIAQKKGDEGGSRLEFTFANNLRYALMETGDGSLDDPYVINRVSDSYGIVSWLKARPRSFGMTFHKGRLLDVITTPEQGPLYFDVSIPMKAYPA